MSGADNYVPEPRPASTDYLIGAHYFPGWRTGTHYGWQKIEPYPERQPLLGFYDEGNPEVADWEIKWALEHGLRFFVYCWYRRGQGVPITARTNYLGHAIHDGLLHARFASRFKFAIMWENQSAGQAGVASLGDLLDHLVPFWIRNYFKHHSYLKVNRKPLLFVYHLARLLEDLGGVEETRAALDQVRMACAAEGFRGATLLCEYRERDPEVLKKIRDCGFDQAFAYCWHAPQSRPTPEQAVAMQLESLRSWRETGVLPFVPTATMGWDPHPWQNANPKTPWLNPDKMARWKLSPAQFQGLLAQVKSFMDESPAGSLGARTLLLDNWNEWGEGHYLAPQAADGFGYLQAVREVFTQRDNQPDYRRPEELGRGPYDSLHREWKTQPK